MDQQLLSLYPAIQSSQQMLAKLSQLKLVIFDVDGVLTDGGLLYGAEGEALKRFNVKDGVAMKLLPKWGVDVAVITAKDSAPLRKRMADLGVKHFYPGSHNKAAAFESIMTALSLTSDQVAYVGDDVIDLQVMPHVALSLCPADAHQLLLRHCDIVLTKSGGRGVAREVADLILASRMPLETAYELAQKPEFETLPSSN